MKTVLHSAIIVICVLLVPGMALAILVFALRRAASSAARQLGQPTPEDAKINQDTNDLIDKIKAQAAKDTQGVQNASGAGLYDLARKRLRKD